MSRLVYFIRPKGQDGPVKIGCSAAPENRLLTLAVWCPYELEVLAAAPGGFDIERRCHLKFARDRLHHEWFAHSPELDAFIEHVAAHGVFPDLPHLPLPKPTPRKHSSPSEREMKGKATRMLNKAMVHAYGWWDRPPYPSHIQAIKVRYGMRGESAPTPKEWTLIRTFCAQMHSRPEAPSWHFRELSWLRFRRDNTPEAPLSKYNLEKLAKMEASA